MSEPEMIDIGHGHFLRWASWSPDRDLNPQFAHLPDVEKCTAIIRHVPLRADDDNHGCQQRGYCEAAASMDGPVTRELFSEHALWQVESWEPLTLSPSILCHCGDHGFIRDGRWVPA
jgi:hypothetical protein